MKTEFLAVATFFVLNTVAFANGPLTGTYQVVNSPGCEQQLSGDAQELTLVATAEELENADGPYSFQVGTVTSAPSQSIFNEFETSFTGSYSADGTDFIAVERIIDRLIPNSPGSFAGQVHLSLYNDILEIDNSLAAPGQFAPSSGSTCFLSRVK